MNRSVDEAFLQLTGVGQDAWLDRNRLRRRSSFLHPRTGRRRDDMGRAHGVCHPREDALPNCVEPTGGKVQK